MDEGTLRIRGYTVDSVFAECHAMQTYVGKEIARIDGHPMHCLAEVRHVLELCDRSPGRDDLPGGGVIWSRLHHKHFHGFDSLRI